MDTFFKLLNTYSGRDSVIRATGYISMYMSSCTSGILSLKLHKFSEELSYCRIILRLFDDLPMLRYSVMYGLGKEERGFVLRVLGVLKNIIDQFYYPVEHIAWASHKNFISANASIFSLASTYLWASSSYISAIRSLIMMSQLQRKTKGLKNVSVHEAIVNEQLELLLNAFQNLADFIIAVHYFPSGSFLWAGKLDRKKIGLCGIISSFLRILMIVRNSKMTESASK